MGKWVTAYIELPEGYDVEDIRIDTVKLNDRFPTTGPTEMKDFDKDNVQELMVKFDWPKMTRIKDVSVIETMTLTVSGLLTNGTAFEGYDVVTLVPSSENGSTTSSASENGNVPVLLTIAPFLLLSGAAVSAATIRGRRS